MSTISKRKTKDFSQSADESKKLKYLVADNYKNDTLFNADFPPDVNIDGLAKLIAEALGEKFPVCFIIKLFYINLIL